MEKSKAQIFMFDLIFSAVIIVVTVAIVLSYYTDTLENTNIDDLNSQIINSFTRTIINDLNSDFVIILSINNKIKNIENTVAQQIGEFYYYGELDFARNLSRDFVEGYIKKEMNYELSLIDDFGVSTILYNLTNQNKPIENAIITSVNQRIVYGFINRSTFYGPYIFRVKLWI